MKFNVLVQSYLQEMAKKVLPDGREFRSSEAAVIELVGEGKSVQEIATELQTSVESIQSIISVAKRKGTWPQELNRAKIRLEDGKEFTTLQAAVIVLAGEGLSISKIAEKLNTSVGTIASVISIARRKQQWPQDLTVAREIRAAKQVAQTAEVEPEQEMPSEQPSEEIAPDLSEYENVPKEKLWYIDKNKVINVANPEVYLEINDDFKVINSVNGKNVKNATSFDEALEFAQTYVKMIRRGMIIKKEYVNLLGVD